MQEQGVEKIAGSAGNGLAAATGKRLAAFNVIERKGMDKPIWHRVGIAFVNRDGSINVFLDSLPLQGKIQLREDRERPEGGGPMRRREPLHDDEV